MRMKQQEKREVKDMTEKQAALLAELLEEEDLEDNERYVFRGIFDSKVSTSYDASVLISHIIGLLNFRRRFAQA